jgi:hypothetical protein
LLVSHDNELETERLYDKFYGRECVLCMLGWSVSIRTIPSVTPLKMFE